MRYRRDDERGFRGMGEYERRWYGGEGERGRSWSREEDMGGSRWSGASGRGGMREREREGGYGGAWGGQREHGGFGSYAGVGERDASRQWGRARHERGGYYRPMSGSDLGFGYREHEGMPARGPHYGKGPKGYRRSDERIREDVCDMIAYQGYIDATDVEVKVENRIVILSGTVAERDEKRALEQMVERVHGVEEVRNELRLGREERRQPEARVQPRGEPQGYNGRSARS